MESFSLSYLLQFFPESLQSPAAHERLLCRCPLWILEERPDSSDAASSALSDSHPASWNHIWNTCL